MTRASISTLLSASMSRRRALGAAGSSALLAASGCCSLRGFPDNQIGATERAEFGTPLKPVPFVPQGLGQKRIDVHAHFFNASDVTVRGYLEGPVAHDMAEPLASLVRALGPVADELAGIAPTAAQEFHDLQTLLMQPAMLSSTAREDALIALKRTQRADASRRFYEAVRNTSFKTQFDEIAAGEAAQLAPMGLAPAVRALGPESLQQAMDHGLNPGNVVTYSARLSASKVPYSGGILEFVGYMLSSRWANLHSYGQAFTSSQGSYGINMTLGALVDFDRWLECPPRSSHDDQVKLHQLLSMLSGGYMRPLVAYNPWSDIKEEGKALARVVDAVQTRGFVGVKLYPPNGFRPFGNTESPQPPGPGPSAADLDRVLAQFWDASISLGVPVMSHTGQTMGRDDAHDNLGGPKGWQALMTRYAGRKAPIINLGHFGGDCDVNTWTDEMSTLMASQDGKTVYGDVAYWSRLGVGNDGSSCGDARARLARAVQHPGVAQRVMYGSDWLMLSRERDWARFPFQVEQASAGVVDRDALFGGNAQRCFGTLLT